MTSEEPDLAAAFTCAARVGWGGYNRGGDALMQAISPSINGPGGCNEGFLRDEKPLSPQQTVELGLRVPGRGGPGRLLPCPIR